jgi:hypothetical protein
MANRIGNPTFKDPEFQKLMAQKRQQAKAATASATAGITELPLSPDELKDPDKVARAYILPRLLSYLDVLDRKARIDGDKDCAKYMADRVLSKLGDQSREQDDFVGLIRELVRLGSTPGPAGEAELGAAEDPVVEGGLPAQP